MLTASQSFSTAALEGPAVSSSLALPMTGEHSTFSFLLLLGGNGASPEASLQTHR